MAEKMNATKVANNANGVKNVTKSEQISTLHVNGVNEVKNLVKIESPKLFRELKAGNSYELPNGELLIINEKITKFGSGGHTVFSGTFNGKRFEKMHIEKLRPFCGYSNEECKNAREGGQRGKITSLAQRDEAAERFTKLWTEKLMAVQEYLGGTEILNSEFQTISAKIAEISAERAERAYVEYLEAIKAEREAKKAEEVKKTTRKAAAKGVRVLDIAKTLTKEQLLALLAEKE